MNKSPTFAAIYKMSFLLILSFLLTGCFSRKLTPYETIEKSRENTNVCVIVQPAKNYIDQNNAGKSECSLTVLGFEIDDFHNWVNNALIAELTTAGYFVINPDICMEPGIEASAYKITHGSVKVDNGVMNLDINVSQGETKVFKGHYQSAEMRFGLWELCIPGRPILKQPFDRSLRSISEEFIKDLDAEIGIKKN